MKTIPLNPTNYIEEMAHKVIMLAPDKLLDAAQILHTLNNIQNNCYEADKVAIVALVKSHQEHFLS